MDEPPDVTLRVLGPAAIRGVDTPLGPKQALLLAALALRDGPVPSDVLVDLLWAESPPENPRASLQVHVSRLRRSLEEAGASVRFQGDGYSLAAERGQVDVRCFHRLSQDGMVQLTSDPATAHDLLSKALALWQGQPLDGAAQETALRADVQRLHDTFLATVAARIEADLSLGRHAEVVAELQQLTREHPFHEGFRRQLLLALYRSGRASEALSAFEELRTLLADELGADPAPVLRELHQRILVQDPSLTSWGPPPSQRTAPSPPTDPASVAVLPFEVIGGHNDTELLATGLHIDLLTELSRVERLTVTSRHSVMPYANGSSPEQVGREVGVATVLVGSIRMAGDRFRLSVQLVDAAGGVQRWAESYDHELNPHNVLTVQRDLASDIAAALSRRLSPAAAAPTTDSMEAYRLVVEGRMQFDLKTQRGFAMAVELFGRAVMVDSNYGLAWAGLAAALAMTANYGYGERAMLLESAESAVVRALASVPDAAEVHEALGLIAEGQFDAPRALREYDTAIRISPGNADAHSWRAWVHLTLGNVDEGLSSARRAVALNPLSAEAVSNLALALIAGGQTTEGLAEGRRADHLSPGYTTAAYYVGLALYDLGRIDEAVEVLTPLAVHVAGELTTPWAGMAPDAALAVVQAAAGDREGAETTLTSIDAEAYPIEVGLAEAALGNHERAHDHFRRLSHVGYGGAMLRHLHFKEVWASVGDDPRLDDLDRRIALSWKVVGNHSARKRQESAPS